MDSPAMSMWVGNMGSASHSACKLGGTTCCVGSTDKGPMGMIPKGKTGQTVSKKAKGKTGGAAATAPRGGVAAAEAMASGASKRHVHWSKFTKAELLQQALCEPMDTCQVAEHVGEIGKQRNVTEIAAYQKAIGWKQRTLVWDLYEICGHDPRKDSVPDFMHTQMVVTKDKLYATAWSLEHAGINKIYSDKEFCSRLRASLPTEFTHGRY